jgi:hypothetical protein
MKLNINDFEKKSEEMDPLEEVNNRPVARPSMKPRVMERALSDDLYSDYGNIKGNRGTGSGEAGSSYYVGEKRPSDFPDIPPLEGSSPAKNKPRIVSKKELEDSGYDNLRDYLNAKQGLTRRKEKNPSPKLIDPSNIRSGPQPEEALLAPKLIDPKNIRSGPQPEEALLKNRVKRMKSGGSVSSASSRADGCATKGKTKGTMITMKYGGKC